MRVRLTVLLLSLGAMGLAPRADAQTTIQVSPGGDLQAAIDTVPDGGVILLAAGTYPSPAGTAPAPEGGWHMNNRSKSFTIRAEVAGTVTLDGQNARPILRFMNSEAQYGRPVTFDGLTFANGLSTADGLAGGVTLMLSRATFLDCTFQGNVSNAPNTGGGAVIVAQEAVAFFINARFTANSTRNYGGGLVVGGAHAHVHNSSFVDNTTSVTGQTATQGAGGGIHVANATLRVTNTLFDGNKAGYVGGGLYVIGTWNESPSPAADVKVANSTFVNNEAVRHPGTTIPPGSPPTEGGAIHAEDQATIEIYGSRFETNQADTGGGVNTYRGIVVIRDSAFLGNAAVGVGNGTGFGGGISAISNDTNDWTTGGGAINRRPASVTVSDSFFQASVPGGISPQAGACFSASGDQNRQYGLNGVAPMGGADTNRVKVSVTRTVFRNCDVQQNTGASGSGIGGGVLVSLGDLTVSDSMVVQSRAFAGVGVSPDLSRGAGVAVFDQSNATLTNCYLAKNSAGAEGGGLLVSGSTVNVSGSYFVANSVTSPPSFSSGMPAGVGSAIFTTPDDARSLPVNGTVQSSVIVGNSGSTSIYDWDRNPAPINDVRYVGNQLRAASGTLVYQDSLNSTMDVNGLNSLVVTRSGSTTDKGSGNTAPSTEPVTGKLLAVPSRRLATAAPGDLSGAGDRTAAYLAYAWSGKPTASVNGTTVSDIANALYVTAAGTQTLVPTGSGTTYSDTVEDAAPPEATLSANPPNVFPGGSTQLSWFSPATGFIEAAIDQGVGDSTAASGIANVTPAAMTTYRYLAMTELGGEVASATVTVGAVTVTPRPQGGHDVDGDRKADLAVYRPSTGTWFLLKSSTGNASYSAIGWGLQAQGDVPVRGDFDGDGLIDPTVYRPSFGTWFILLSSANYADHTWFGWGNATDKLVPGDYDGDGRTDAAVYRPSTGEWYIRPSNGAQWSKVFGGQAGDVPMPGDFDGDTKTDLVIYRPATGTWFILKSSSNFTSWYFRGWGLQAQGDTPVPGDYDGDRKTDVAVYRPGPGTWFILKSSANDLDWTWAGWGNATDVPVPADYDGDARTDLAVYRPSTGEWYVKPSNGSVSWSRVFGQGADVPLQRVP